MMTIIEYEAKSYISLYLQLTRIHMPKVQCVKWVDGADYNASNAFISVTVDLYQ